MNYFRCGGGRSTHTATKIDVAKTPLATFESNVSGLYLPEILAYIQASQAGTGDPSPSNPRAISGVSSVDTTRTGKNLSTAPLVYATAYASTQVTEDGKSCTRFTCASTTIYTSVRFKPNTRYTVKFNAKTVKSGTPTVNSGAFVFFYSDNTYSAIYVGKEDTPWTDYTLTSTSGKTVIGVGTLATDWRLLVYVDNDTFQLEESNTATAYAPYTGTTATTALGGTYYGGYLNVTTGVLTVTYAKYKIKDLGTFARYTNFFLVNIGTLGFNSTDHYKCETFNNVGLKYDTAMQQQPNYSLGYSGTSFKFRYDDSTDVNSFLADVGDDIVIYELTTPQTVQLTPAQIEQLLGQNNVFCSSGDVAVKYWKID